MAVSAVRAEGWFSYVHRHTSKTKTSEDIFRFLRCGLKLGEMKLGEMPAYDTRVVIHASATLAVLVHDDRGTCCQTENGSIRGCFHDFRASTFFLENDQSLYGQ